MGKRTRRKRSRHHIRRRTSPGAAPGTIVVDPQAPRPVIQVVAYSTDAFEEMDELRDIEQLRGLLDRYTVTWVNVAGLGDAETISVLGRIFGLHPLAMEDVVNVHQRAKVEQYGDHLFIIARMVGQTPGAKSEQLSLFLGNKYVLTFQERPGDCFGAVRDRLRKAHGRTRGTGSDYLAYTLLDAVIDSYFPLVEEIGDRIERLDEEVTTRHVADAMTRIHDIRGELLLLRRGIWPHRDAVNELIRDPHPLISLETRVYLRDCYDHTIQLIDLLDIYRELCSDLRDYYLSTISNRLNETMKVLTIIATIFIPLSFITGIYGMNFNPDSSPWNMPELNWRYGYPAALALMAAVAIGLLFFFRKRGWIGIGDTTVAEENGDEH